MRREFNPTLRAASSRKAVKKTIEDTVVDLTLMEGDSTTLYYSGSPLMQTGVVGDPNNQDIIVGVNETKKSLPGFPVLAIGLATDDATTDAGDPSIRPPVGGSIKYNQDAPNRPCVFFDLSSIPSDAIIEEATLELEVVEETEDFYDIFFSLFDGPGRPIRLPSNSPFPENVWPDSLTLEALNLSRHATPNATWNYYDSSINNSNRWKSISAEEGTFLPNPIGMMQNTRRSDYPEPSESYDEQRIDPSSDSFPTESYGHIGYGIDGGGFVENYPHTSEDLVVEDSDSTFVFDVTDQVQYGYDTNNKKCNLIVRATNPGPNLAAASPDAQVEIEPVKLDSVHISDTPDGAVLDPPEEEQEQTVHCVLEGLENATEPVTYQWWKESAALEPFGELDVIFDGNVKEKTGVILVVVSNAISVGGDPPTNVLQFDWITTSPEGGQTTQQTSSSTPTMNDVLESFSIPEDLGNHNLKCFITMSNPALDPVLEILDLGTISFDLEGVLTVTVTTGPTSPGEVVNGNILQVTSTVDGVVAPTFDYEFAKDGTVIDSQSDVSDLTSGLYTINLPPYVPGSGIYSITTVLKEGGIQVDDETLTWSYNVEEVTPVSWVEVPEYRSGVYKLKDNSPPLLTQPNRWDASVVLPCLDVPGGPQFSPDFNVDLDVIEDSKCTGDGSFSGKPYLNNNNPIIAFLAPNGAQIPGDDPCPQGVGIGNVALDRYPRLINGENIPITVFSKFGFGGEWEAGIGSDGNGLKRPTDMAVWSANGGWRYYVAYSYLCKFVPITVCLTGNIQALDNPSQTGIPLADTEYSKTSGDVNRELNNCSSTFGNDGSSTVTGWLQIAGPALPNEGIDLGETWFFHFRDGWSAGRPGEKGKFEPTDIDSSLHFTGGIPRPDQAMLNSWPNPSEFMTETGGTPSGQSLAAIPEANPLLWNPQSGFDLTFPSHIVHAQLGADPQLPSNFNEDPCPDVPTPLLVRESQLTKNESLYGYMKLGDDFSHEANPSNANHYGPGSVSPLICGTYMAVCVEPDQESPDNTDYFDRFGNPLPPDDRESLAFHKWVIDHPDYQYIVEVYRTDVLGVRNLHGIICSNSSKAFRADITVEDLTQFPRSIYWQWSPNKFLSSTFYKAGDELIVYMFNDSSELTNAITQAKVKYVGAFSGINDNGSNLVTFNETSAINIGIPDIPT